MKYSNPILVLSLVSFAVLSACGNKGTSAAEAEVQDEGTSAAEAEVQDEGTSVVEAEAQAPDEPKGLSVPAGEIGIIQNGDFSFGDSDVTWIVHTNEPLFLDYEILGSRGEGRGGRMRPAYLEGKCIYRLHFSHKEVKGTELLNDVEFFGGEEASARLMDADPELAERSACRYTWDVRVTDEDLEATTGESVQRKSGFHQSGWLAASLSDSGEGWTKMSGCRGEEEIEYHRIGFPILLAWCIEAPTDRSAFGYTPSAKEFTIRFPDESGEEQEISLSDYEGRAWAIRVTFKEVE